MKRLLRPIWLRIEPIRARFWARHEEIVSAVIERALIAQNLRRETFESIHAEFSSAERRAAERAEELALVLDAVVAEQFRLQAQIEDLRRRLDEAHASAADPGWD
jgi:hypothetical protein